MQLVELIDKAAKAAGSDYKLAQQLGVGRSLVSDWRHGRKPCSLEDRALMANIAGVSAVYEVITGMLERHAGTPKGERLAAVLERVKESTMYIM